MTPSYSNSQQIATAIEPYHAQPELPGLVTDNYDITLTAVQRVALAAHAIADIGAFTAVARRWQADAKAARPFFPIDTCVT